jgi:hypothetical protein
MVLTGLLISSLAHAQDLTATVADGSYHVLGGETVQASASVPEGFEPVNGNVAYVYDPNFYFYMRGYQVDPSFDRRAEFKSYGYVVVDAAGDPGGNYRTAPSWITHTGFSASYAESRVTLSYSYNASYVPVMRGYQGYIIYSNLKRTPAASQLYVYDDKLVFGPGNYLMTGDGPEAAVTLSLGSPDAAQGSSAIEVQTSRNTGGSHWKLMLFANGNAAAYKGADLRAYTKLAFYAKASRDVVLQGGFGTGDDSGSMPIAPLKLTTKYQRFELDISRLDRSDINTLLWVYLHKSVNPVDFTNLSVFLDGIELLTSGASQDGVITVDSGSDSLNGLCKANGSRTGKCNLRAALALAATIPGKVDVRIEVDQTVSLDQIVVTPTSERVSISGVGGQKVIKGAGQLRLFQVQAGASLALTRLAISNFNVWDGGAILNDGDLTLDGVRVSDNSAQCSGTGAMTSFAMCSGGALSNHGTLALRGGTSFENNIVLARSSTASFTNASAGGGAILNSGVLTIDGEVLFADNISDASATSGWHNGAPSGASASSSGGAIWHAGGRLSVVGGGVGHCTFRHNSALAEASTSDGSTGQAMSVGGAISSLAELQIPAGACQFSENVAGQDPDIHVQP